MQSLRAAYEVVSNGETEISFQNFFWTPDSLSQALHAMAPATSFSQTGESYWDDSDWTEELQGVACDGANWFYSSGGSKAVGGLHIGRSPLAIMTFPFASTGRNDGDWSHRFTVAEVGATSINAKVPVGGSRQPPGIDHLGGIECFDGQLFADHFIGNQCHILVLDNAGGALSFNHWIPLECPPGVERLGMVAINHANRTFITCDGEQDVSRMFVNDFNGMLVRRANGQPRELTLHPGIKDGCYVQGGGLSGRGHLYVASGKEEAGGQFQMIYIYSVLTGRLLGVVFVLAQNSNQEMEGMCLAPVTVGGVASHLHVILLENMTAPKDNVFAKRFTAAQPDLI